MKLHALWIDPTINCIAGLALLRRNVVLGSVCSADAWCSGYMDPLRRGWTIPEEIFQFTKKWNDTHFEQDRHGNQINKQHPALMINEWVTLGCPGKVPHRVWPNGKDWQYMTIEFFQSGEGVDGFVPRMVPEEVQFKLPKFFSPKAPPPADLDEVKRRLGLCF